MEGRSKEKVKKKETAENNYRREIRRGRDKEDKDREDVMERGKIKETPQKDDDEEKRN